MTAQPNLPTVADVRADAEHCSYNAKLCRFACPVATATGRESVTPWGINRAITAAAKAGAVTEATAASVYGCTGCRACGSVCLPGLDLPTHVRAARAEVARAGLAPAGTEAGAGHATAADAALAAGATPGAPTVVYPGCRSTDGAALAAVLAAADQPYDVVGEPTCCGARSVDVGLVDRGRGQLAELGERLAGASTVVVADPHCARWLATDCDDERVAALPAFLSTLVGRLTFHADPTAVSWHDPCWLGRGQACYEEPRAVVQAAAGRAPVEPARTRDRAACTGGGMGYADTDPEGAARMVADRAHELRMTEETVVTACPTAAARLRDTGLDAHDLAGFLASRLRRPEEGRR